MTARLTTLYCPRSVAVIGASRDAQSIGGALLRNLVETFPGPVYPVNPRAGEIAGRRAYAAVAELPQPLDLAFVVVPGACVVDVARQCAALTRRTARGYPAAMRLSDRKIESLAEKMLRWLEAQPDVQLLEPRDTVRDALIAELQDERDIERRLDDDVDRILAENESRMRSEQIDPWLMRKKVRAQLARERGIVI